MKKIICLVVVILMIAAVAYAAKKVAITTKNVASLKGTWTGSLSFATIGAAGGISSQAVDKIEGCGIGGKPFGHLPQTQGSGP